VRWPLIVLLVVLLVSVPGAGLGYREARGLQGDVVAHFSAAQAHLERARSLVTQASGPQAQGSLEQARAEFQSARREFGAGIGVVDGSALHAVPQVIGPVSSRVGAVDHLGAMGMALCDAGLLSIDVDGLFLAPPAPGQPTGTARLLRTMTQAQDVLPALARDLDRARSEAAAVDPAVLPGAQRPAFAKATADIAKGIAGVVELGRIVPALGDILAVDGRRTYLVEQANPFELRAGGGYIGTYSLLAADHGTLTVLRSGDTHDLPDFTITTGQPGYVAPPSPMLGLLQSKSWSLGDSNFSPAFPDDARAAAGFTQRDFGTAVDGVISIDLYAVNALLDVTGPLSPPGSGVTLTKDNFIPTAMAGDLTADPTHKTILTSVAGQLMQRLVSLGSDQWLHMIQVLDQLATQRHLQLFFTSGGAQAEMARLGLAGELALSGHDDFLDLGEANLGGNKANFFVTRTLAVDLSRAGRSLHHVLTENLSLDLSKAPRGYVVPYSLYDRLLVPASATGLAVTGLTREDQPSLTPPAGVAVLEGRALMTPAGANHTASLRITYAWDTPWSQDASGAHRVYWQKQPGVAQDAVAVTWNAGAGAPASTARSDLGTDRLLTLSGATVAVAAGNAAQVTLPRL